MSLKTVIQILAILLIGFMVGLAINTSKPTETVEAKSVSTSSTIFLESSKTVGGTAVSDEWKGPSSTAIDSDTTLAK